MRALRTTAIAILIASAGSAVSLPSFAAGMATEVGGAPIYPDKSIIENAANSEDHTSPVAAVKTAGLVEILQSDGPFRGLRATNTAFDRLPNGTVDTPLEPEHKDTLVGILTYHLLRRRRSSAARLTGGGPFSRSPETMTPAAAHDATAATAAIPQLLVMQLPEPAVPHQDATRLSRIYHLPPIDFATWTNHAERVKSLPSKLHLPIG